MVAVISWGYFIRDLIVLLLSLAIIVVMALIGRNAKNNMGFKYFSRVFDMVILTFVLVAIAQTIGVLLRTTILGSNQTFYTIRSVLLVIAAIFIFLSSFLIYLPFGRGRYMVVPLATEPAENLKYGGYWGSLDEVYKAFVLLSKRYRLPAMAVSREPPEVFRGKLGLKLVPVLWISKVNKEGSVNPTRLPYLLNYLEGFLEATNMDKVILIDCIEYLILENGEEAILKFITSLKDLTSINRGILLVAIDKNAVDKRVFNFIKSEFSEVSELMKTLAS
ncbi:hypothetical protein A3L09_01260 [Thermococcus profundus]|uniref:DUF835 domain-containing protein n=1 Tax=Thermococcus profundus TaxID=49899 RepID=A0A2Z2MDE6_THEPR|nr:DUF835 domain-containing protein [Thermococcus profundus]ASJ01984.1 hypothetical protein A3L09_01260 [Thermococcus profundus]